MKAIRQALTYDDVLLVPQYSEIVPTDTSTATTLAWLKFELPFISAPMDTVTEAKMAIAVAQAGGLGMIHKNMSAAKQAAEVKKVAAKKLTVGAAVSVSDEQFDRAKQLVKAGATVLVVDSAHGHSAGVMKQVKRLKKEFKKKVVIIGGNVATAAGTRDLIKAGADVVKVGIGPGSICTTRIVAGIGVPQLTAVMDCVAEAKKTKKDIIADGGIKYSGDIVKALAAGSNMIMAGGLFSGTDANPGKVVTVNGEKMKSYRGMGSMEAMPKGSKDRYGQGKKKDKRKLVAEGISGYVKYKGKVADVLHQLHGGVQSGLGYNGAKDIKTLQRVAQFVQISGAGLKESHPHTLAAIKEAPNYKK